MLQSSTITDGNKTVLIDESGNFYSYNSIIKNVLSYVRLIRKLKLNQPNYVIGIYFKDVFSAISAFIACTLEPVNFTLIPATNDLNDVLVKINHAGVNVLFSDQVSTINILTINNDFLITTEGVEISRIDKSQRLKFLELCLELRKLKADNATTDSELNDIITNLYGKTGNKKTRHFIGFHSGITSLFKASVFQIEALHCGIERATALFTKKDTKIVFDAPFELLYDIISGVISPILIGKTVIFNSDRVLDYSPTTLYTSAAKLNSFTLTLEKEDSFLYRLRNVKLLNSLGLNIIRWLRIKNKFNKLYGKTMKAIYTTGKLDSKDYTFFGKFTAVNIFALAEVVSFVSFKRFNKFLPKQQQNVGIVEGQVSVENILETENVSERALGELFVYVPDSCVSYLQIAHLKQNHINYSFVHGFPGKIRTGDAGYIKNNELYIVGKSKFTYIQNNQLVEVQKIIKILQQESFVKHCAVLLHNAQLIVLFDLHRDYILTNSDLTYEKLLQKCTSLKLKINDTVSKHSNVNKVMLYPDPNGMKEIHGKLVSRYF